MTGGCYAVLRLAVLAAYLGRCKAGVAVHCMTGVMSQLQHLGTNYWQVVTGLHLLLDR